MNNEPEKLPQPAAPMEMQALPQLRGVSITGFDTYRDGGSTVYQSDIGEIVRDRRAESKETPAWEKWWLGYPGSEGARLLTTAEVASVYEELRRIRFCLDYELDR